MPNGLHKSLLSTNCIENTFKNLRRHIGKVCRWREETDQADRRLASGLTLASKGFRRVAGHRELPQLIRALERKYESGGGAGRPTDLDPQPKTLHNLNQRTGTTEKF